MCIANIFSINLYLDINSSTKTKVSTVKNKEFFKFELDIINLLNKENKYDCETVSESSIIRVKINKVISLLYKIIEKITNFSIELYNKIVEKYEWIPKILDLIKEFKELFQKKNLNFSFLSI